MTKKIKEVAIDGFYKEKGNQVNYFQPHPIKGMRTKSGTLTLCHKSPDKGLKPIPIFNRFGYIKPSKRDGTLKKKLFATVTGKKPNSLQFKLIPDGATSISMQYQDEFICKWNLSN